MGGQQTQTAAGGIENRAERGRAERPPANRGRRDPRHDVLFTPLQIGPKQTPNRFYQVPQCGPGGTVKPWTQAAHRGLKAEGGWGVVCVEETNVSRDADQTPLYMGTLWDDADAARYSLVCDAVHEHGSLAGVELAHGGLRSWNRGSRWPHLAPSPRAVVGAVSGEAPTAVARAMDLDDIRRVQNDFAVAAERAIVAGFDIVYVYASAGFLPAQFLSPQINRRADAYGGSFENRARFLLETLRRVREAVDGRAAVAVRIAVDRGTSPPYAVDPTNLLALIALADELVDLWDINDGGVDWTFAYGGLDSTSARFYPEGYLAQLTTELRSTTDKPIVGVARLTDPTTMARIIDAGIWDLIGAARPSIADPFLPAKIAAGRYDEVRECTGSNLCILTVRNNGVSACVQNATAMEEHRRGWHPERFTNAANRDRDVLIIGAGPAGMECAIVLAKRGFTRIHLADAAPDLGGHLRWVSRLPGMGSWARIVDWRRIQIAKLRAITPVLGTELDLASARIYGAHIIIVAAGARWAIDGIDPWSADPIPGLDARLPHVLTPEQVFADQPIPGDRVVVYDCDGYFTGVGIAERLAQEGRAVTLVTPMSGLAPVLKDTKESTLVGRRIRELGIKVMTDSAILRCEPGGLELAGPYGATRELTADAVVAVTQRLADDNLYTQLKAIPEALAAEEIEAVFRVGDCNAPRLITEAVFDGHRLAREIDARDPAVPLPHRRELPTVTRR